MKAKTIFLLAVVVFLLSGLAFGSICVLAQDTENNDEVMYSKLIGLTEVEGQIKEIELPLKHTTVKAEVSGYITKVDVEQEYVNNLSETVEAIYVFPLPESAAIYSMEMIIGDRVIKGVIKEREEAKAIYEQAKQEGKRTSLLEQERPNIFTQSVANLMPNDKITIKISYVETLDYDSGKYTFVFPMVVGPRYVPVDSQENPLDTDGDGLSDQEELIIGSDPYLSDTDGDGFDDFTEFKNGYNPAKEGGLSAESVTEILNRRTARNIDAPILPPDSRSGHDISLSLHINTGNIALKDIRSTTHDIDTENISEHEARVTLRASDSIPNKDFVLNYDVSGILPEFAVLTEKNVGDDGFFALMIQPPVNFNEKEVLPKEMFFIVDISGSMSGVPIQLVKQAMTFSLQNLNPQDTFNIYLFANNLLSFSPEPLLATDENIKNGLAYISKINSGGGTEMMAAIKKAVTGPLPIGRLRIVSIMTDGQIYNDDQVLKTIQAGDMDQIRFFSFSIGSAPNRYLLDKMAEIGRGKSFYVGNNDNPEKAINDFYARIDAPVYINLKLDWGGLDVYDIYPVQLPDLFIGEPVYVTGRYKNSGQFDINLSGVMASLEASSQNLTNQIKNFFSDEAISTINKNMSISANFPSVNTSEFGISSIWARSKIDKLMDDYRLASGKDSVKQNIVDIGIKYHLMTNFTSFVAVEEKIVNENGEIKTVKIPVELPAGTTYEGYFGKMMQESSMAADVWGGSAAGLQYTAVTALGSSNLRTVIQNTVFMGLAGLLVILFIIGLIILLKNKFLTDRKKSPDQLNDNELEKKKSRINIAKRIMLYSLVGLVVLVVVSILLPYLS